MLALQNCKSQNKQMTNSRVCFKLSGCSSVCTHRESSTSQSLSHEHPLRGESLSFPTDNCRCQCVRLGSTDFGNCLLYIRKATISWGYSKQVSGGVFPLWAYPKDIDFCFCSLYEQRLSLKCCIKAHNLENSDLMLRAAGLGSAPAPSWHFPV